MEPRPCAGPRTTPQTSINTDTPCVSNRPSSHPRVVAESFAGWNTLFSRLWAEFFRDSSRSLRKFFRQRQFAKSSRRHIKNNKLRITTEKGICFQFDDGILEGSWMSECSSADESVWRDHRGSHRRREERVIKSASLARGRQPPLVSARKRTRLRSCGQVSRARKLAHLRESQRAKRDSFTATVGGRAGGCARRRLN